MKVRVVEDVAEQIRTWSSEAAPLETGGLLLGLYANGDPWITRVVLIESEGRTGSRYELPAGVTQDAVRQAQTEDPRVGYLGDWHSHPADVGPSPTDLGSLRWLARRAIGRGRRPPIIVVARLRKGRWLLDARMGLRWPFTTRTADVIVTGPPEVSGLAPTATPRPRKARAESARRPGARRHPRRPRAG